MSKVELLSDWLNMNRHSWIYTLNVVTHKKTTESENRVNRGYFVLVDWHTKKKVCDQSRSSCLKSLAINLEKAA